MRSCISKPLHFPVYFFNFFLQNWILLCSPSFEWIKTAKGGLICMAAHFCYWHFILVLSFLIYSIMHFNSTKQIKPENMFVLLSPFISTWGLIFRVVHRSFRNCMTSSLAVVRMTQDFAYVLCKLSGEPVGRKWSHSAYLKGK